MKNECMSLHQYIVQYFFQKLKEISISILTCFIPKCAFTFLICKAQLSSKLGIMESAVN